MVPKLVSDKDYEVVTPECSYLQAARRMAREGVHALYVVHNERLVGVVSHIDFVYPLRHLSNVPSDTTVADIMSSPVQTLSMEDSLKAAKSILGITMFVLIPVTSADGRLVGAISCHDLFRYLHLSEADGRLALRDLVG